MSTTRETIAVHRNRNRVRAAAAAVLVLTGVLGAGIVADRPADSHHATAPCQAVAGRDYNGAAIISTGLQMHVPPQGIVAGLDAGIVETGLLSLANPRVPASLRGHHDGLGVDHLAVGVLQQQAPAWGSVEDLMTPQGAARAFYTALQQIPGWQTMPVGQAVQLVQRSPYPDAYAVAVPAAETYYREHRADVVACEAA